MGGSTNGREEHEQTAARENKLQPSVADNLHQGTKRNLSGNQRQTGRERHPTDRDIVRRVTVLDLLGPNDGQGKVDHLTNASDGYDREVGAIFQEPYR